MTRGIRKSIQFVCFMPLRMLPSACHIPSSVYKDRKNSDLLQKNTNKFRYAQNICIKYTNALHENHSAHAAGQMPLSARNPLIFRILHRFSRFPYKWLSFIYLTSPKIQGTYFKIKGTCQNIWLVFFATSHVFFPICGSGMKNNASDNEYMHFPTHANRREFPNNHKPKGKYPQC